MNREPVVVSRFYDASAAHLARCNLVSQGIAAEIIDEHTVGVNPLYANAVGGVKIVVRPVDAQRAREILLRQREKICDSETPEKMICPRCQSSEVRRTPVRGVFVLLAALTLGIAWLLFWKKYKCQSCGYTW